MEYINIVMVLLHYILVKCVKIVLNLIYFFKYVYGLSFIHIFKVSHDILIYLNR
jgi:hypothetical protein